LVTILVNNAGVGNTDPAHEVSLDAINDVIDTNFRGPFLLAAEVARRLIAAGSPGRIVNISSVGAHTHSSHTTAALYCATKSGVLRLTETLALEWARYGINVNAIAPGLFRTEMSEAHMKNADQISKAFPRGRIGEPAYLDSTLLYLVAPASEFVTGISILVDDAQFPR
jgi:NAD(P)-dependent dehydrogenase (short-subunit alcohol dehydrogenase family)